MVVRVEEVEDPPVKKPLSCVKEGEPNKRGLHKRSPLIATSPFFLSRPDPVLREFPILRIRSIPQKRFV